MSDMDECGRCGHMRYHHRNKCGYIDFSGSTALVSVRVPCDCDEFDDRGLKGAGE